MRNRSRALALIVVAGAVLWLLKARETRTQDDHPLIVETVPDTASPKTPGSARSLASVPQPSHRPAPVRSWHAKAVVPNQTLPTPPPAEQVDSVWEKPLRRFAGSEILSTYETDPDQEGNFTRVDILKTDFKYPLIKMRERWHLDPTTGKSILTGRSAMVADHVLVTLRPGISQDQFVSFLAQNNWSILKRMPYSGIYLVSIEGTDPTALDQALNVLRDHPEIVARSSPDYIAFNNE